MGRPTSPGGGGDINESMKVSTSEQTPLRRRRQRRQKTADPVIREEKGGVSQRTDEGRPRWEMFNKLPVDTARLLCHRCYENVDPSVESAVSVARIRPRRYLRQVGRIEKRGSPARARRTTGEPGRSLSTSRGRPGTWTPAPPGQLPPRPTARPSNESLPVCLLERVTS